MHQSPEPYITTPSGAEAALPAIIDALPADAARVSQHQFTRRRQAAFLKLLADSGEVRVASRKARVSHQTVYRMRRACSTFRAGWDAALIVARELAEEALATRAMHGVEEEVFYHGEVVATRRRYDSRLLLAHLGRLDRLAEREDVADLAMMFDSVVEAFEEADEGEIGELGEVAPEEVAVMLPEGAPEIAPGPCNMRSMSHGAEGAEEEDEGELPELERRLRAMEAARPREAVPISDMTTVFQDEGSIEDAQLEAFEEGQERWWEVMPPLGLTDGDGDGEEEELESDGASGRQGAA